MVSIGAHKGIHVPDDGFVPFDNDSIVISVENEVSQTNSYFVLSWCHVPFLLFFCGNHLAIEIAC